MADQIAEVTLGTAGHIDHGKSALVQRLTGIDPDRLKEEQARGMTIDLGYANFLSPSGLRVGVIDVPGHEKFIRNMVTGAASIDIVILVVAADDGVMPQTREHLEIMEVMGIRAGFTALTKIDLVDEEMVELASEDVKELTKGTFLEGTPIIPVSSISGQGFDRLTEELDQRLNQVKHTSPSGLFRVPVQRAFSAKGFGTVVTGVPISGSVKPGEVVEVLPQGVTGKVRGLQAFGQSCEEGKAGHRIAINISDVDYRTVHRGCTVATPGYFKTTQFFEGRFFYFKNTGFPLKNRTEVKVHSGTAEEMGRVILLDSKVLTPGQEGFIQVRLENPMVVVAGDRFLLRRHSPATSLGGGVVVEQSDRKAKRFKTAPLERLDAKFSSLGDEIASLLDFEMQQWKAGFFTKKDMALAISQTEEVVNELLEGFVAEGVVAEAGQGLFIHKDSRENLSKRIEEALHRLHEKHPMQPYIDTNLLRSELRLDINTLQQIAKIMEADGVIETTKGGRIRIAGQTIQLDEEQERLVGGILDQLLKAELNPPTLDEIASAQRISPAEAEDYISYLKAHGKVKRIASFYLSIEVLDRLMEVIRDCAREHGEVILPKVKEQLPTTRKYIIPIMEYLDGTGFTRREGDKRYLTSK